MTDSTLVTVEHITNTKCAKNRIDKYGVQHVADTTTIHCTAGNKSSKALDTVLYWERNNIPASATYVVGGDASVCQNVLEADRPWTTGGLSEEDMKKLGRNYETGAENDYHAITIEVASNTSGTEITEAAFAKLIDLVTDICIRHGKTKALWFGDNAELMVKYVPAPNEMKFTWHRWFAQKACPGQYIMNRMQQLIDEVNRRLSGVAPAPVPQPAVYKDDKFVWDKLNAVINNDYGVAGLMGNLQAESGVRSNNLQNSFEKSLSMSDEVYTAAVDNGSYTNFVNDKAGYGLAQWTYWTRKQNMFNFIKARNASIADLATQADFLLNELGTYYKGVLTQLQTATSVAQASDVVLTQYEKPKNQSDAVKQARAALGMDFYNKYAGTAPTPEPAPGPMPEPQPLPPDSTPIIVQDIQAGDTVRITNESLINMLITNYTAMLHGPLKVSAVNGEVATIALPAFDISVNDLLEIGAEAQLVAVTPYIVQVKRVLPLNVYAQPKDGAKVNTTINSAGIYTIVAQTTDNKYGQLKSGAGYVRLADVDRV